MHQKNYRSQKQNLYEHLPIIKLSVIICTYNRAELLESCLESFRHQTISDEQCEIIVVNNNSTDNTPAVIQSFAKYFTNLKAVFEPNQGLSHARNRGYKEAKADWVIYIDDDGKAHPNLVEQTFLVIDQYDFHCFGGVYLPWYKYGKSRWLPPNFGTNKLNKPKSITQIGREVYLSGGVLAFNKTTLEKFNGFDPTIGMNGKKVSYGEEIRLQILMHNKGYKLGFNPDLKIDHLVNIHKLTKRWLLESAYANGRDYWHAFNKKKSILTLLRTTLKHFYNSIKEITGVFSGKTYLIQWYFSFRRSISFTYGLLGSFRKS